MGMTRSVVVVLGGALLALMARSARAQTVRGQLTDSISHSPLPGAFLTLVDAQGVERARAITGGSGEFTLTAPASGTYRIRSKRIGFKPYVSEELPLTTGLTVSFNAVIDPIPVALEQVVVAGDRQCDIEAGASVAALWEEVKEALAAVAWTSKTPGYWYRVNQFERENVQGQPRRPDSTWHNEGFYEVPFKSVEAEQLEREGFVFVEDDEWSYRGPDAEVLLSAPFLRTHCFESKVGKGETEGLVGLGFSPARGRKLPDINGTLWIDRHTGELRHLEFKYVRLPRNLSAPNAGGRVEFMRVQRLAVEPDKPPVSLLARAVEAEGRVPPLLGAAHAVGPGEPPAAWVSEIAASIYGWRLGSTIELPLGGRRARFTVAGVWRDYARQQGAVLIERYQYLRYTGDAYANDAAVWLAPGADAGEVRRDLEARLAGGANIETSGPEDIREVSLRIFDRTFAVTYALEAVAVAIGLFGLSSSFGALVLARRREFGVLRHLGMTRRQIGAMLAGEGLLVSALGLAVGLALGFLISLVLIDVVNPQSFHWGMELHVPWRLLAEFVAAMLAMATLTAIWSGRGAMGGEAVRAVKEDW